MLTRLPLAFLLALSLTGFPELLKAQGGYSVAGANQYVATKNWPSLLAYTKGWTRADPNEPMAWYYLGQTYGIGFNQPAQAANAFQRAVALRHDWPEAWHALAFTSVQSKQYQQAIAAARQAIAQMPERPNYWNTLAAAYSEAQDHDRVIQTLHQEQEHMSRASSYDWYNLGNGYENAVLFREAITAYNQSIRMKADDGKVWNNRGLAEEALGQSVAALSDYQRAFNLGDNVGQGNYARLKLNLATNQSHSGRGPGHCVPNMNWGPACHAECGPPVYCP